MAKKKGSSSLLSIQEAMDNLAAIIGIDLVAPPLLGIIQNSRIVTDADEIGSHEVAWLSGEGAEVLLEILDRTFQTLHRHLISSLEAPDMNWDDPKVKQGIAGMVAMAADAADKMDSYLAFRLEKPVASVKERPAYQELYRFYHNHFAKKIEGMEREEEGDEEETILFDISKEGLKDFEKVLRDQEYELFMIRNEEGQPYFDSTLLQNIKVAAFEGGPDSLFEDDPLLRIRALVDRDLQASARQILAECEDAIEDFYKIIKKITEMNLAQALSMSLTALFLSSNPHNLIQNTSGKSSLQYFYDFQLNLRRAMNSSDYQKFTAYPPAKGDKIPNLLLQLTHALCRAFFYHPGGVKQEAIGLLHICMRKGEEKEKKSDRKKGKTIWTQLFIDDENFRTFLNQFPNGPLFKILDLVRETETEESTAFDPLLQGNFPQEICKIKMKEQLVDVLRIPCPTRQTLINKVVIAEEFRGLLRSYGGEGKKTKIHLLINLQDRLSWQEAARSLSIEHLQKNAEFNGRLVVVTLSKDSDFYHQNNEYLNLNQADEFKKQLKKQLSHAEEYGFFFPSQLSYPQLHKFIDSIVDVIHEQFFDGKSDLNRQNRKDFIEIFYQLFVLKLIDQISPVSMSFSCKDALDTGAGALATFFGFVQILNGEMDKEVDFLRWLLYTPALFVRERVIDPERLIRAISALERIDSQMQENHSEIKHLLASHYHPQVIKNLRIEHF